MTKSICNTHLSYIQYTLLVIPEVSYQKVGIMLHIQKDCPSNLIYLVASLIILVFFSQKLCQTC